MGGAASASGGTGGSRRGGRPDPRAIVAGLCAAQVLGMAGTMAFPALMPLFLAEWRLGAAEAGWIAGVFYAAYAAAVPVLVTLTDRVDPKAIYATCTGLAALALLGFALFADGFRGALLFQALGGVALAGTYMPGMRALAEHVRDGALRGRCQSFLTGAFVLGMSGSVLLAGLLGHWVGWRWALGLAALGPLLALQLVLAALPPAPPPADPPPLLRLLDFRPVLRNRRAMAYVFGYGAHSWESYTLRAWLVAFLAFSAGAQATPPGAATVTVVATAVVLIGVPATILGNEAAARHGRRRVVAAIMLASAALGACIGFAAALPFWLVAGLLGAYGVATMADSAALTVGTVDEADPARRGATLAMHSLMGFVAAFAGPVAFGAALEWGGGPERPGAWGLAFLVLAAGAALGPLALALHGGRGAEAGARGLAAAVAAALLRGGMTAARALGAPGRAWRRPVIAVVGAAVGRPKAAALTGAAAGTFAGAFYLSGFTLGPAGLEPPGAGHDDARAGYPVAAAAMQAPPSAVAATGRPGRDVAALEREVARLRVENERLRGALVAEILAEFEVPPAHGRGR